MLEGLAAGGTLVKACPLAVGHHPLGQDSSIKLPLMGSGRPATSVVAQDARQGGQQGCLGQQGLQLAGLPEQSRNLGGCSHSALDVFVIQVLLQKVCAPGQLTCDKGLQSW